MVADIKKEHIKKEDKRKYKSRKSELGDSKMYISVIPKALPNGIVVLIVTVALLASEY